MKHYTEIPIIVDYGDRLMLADYIISNDGSVERLMHATDLSIAISYDHRKSYNYVDTSYGRESSYGTHCKVYNGVDSTYFLFENKTERRLYLFSLYDSSLHTVIAGEKESDNKPCSYVNGRICVTRGCDGEIFIGNPLNIADKECVIMEEDLAQEKLNVPDVRGVSSYVSVDGTKTIYLYIAGKYGNNLFVCADDYKIDKSLPLSYDNIDYDRLREKWMER